MLKVDDVVSSRTIVDLFRVGNMGGMRRSHTTNSLVLISDHTKGIYDDRWEGDTLYYTGMGLQGNQSLTAQNKTVYESSYNKIVMHLFEVHIPRQYRYRGEVVLGRTPFQEEQLDINNHLRMVWVFPLKLVSGLPSSIPQAEYDELNYKKLRHARRLSNGELEQRVIGIKGVPGKIGTSVTRYYRNADVAEYVRRRANGRCELCKIPPPSFQVMDSITSKCTT